MFYLNVINKSVKLINLSCDLERITLQFVQKESFYQWKIDTGMQKIKNKELLSWEFYLKG